MADRSLSVLDDIENSLKMPNRKNNSSFENDLDTLINDTRASIKKDREATQAQISTMPAPAAPAPQESWYTRLDKKTGGLLPFGAPVQQANNDIPNYGPKNQYTGEVQDLAKELFVDRPTVPAVPTVPQEEDSTGLITLIKNLTAPQPQSEPVEVEPDTTGLLMVGDVLKDMHQKAKADTETARALREDPAYMTKKMQDLGLAPQEGEDPNSLSNIGKILTRAVHEAAFLPGTREVPRYSTGNKVADAITNFLGTGLGFVLPAPGAGGMSIKAGGQAVLTPGALGKASEVGGRIAPTVERIASKVPAKVANTLKLNEPYEIAERAMRGAISGGIYGANRGLAEGQSVADIPLAAVEDALVFATFDVGLPYVFRALGGLKNAAGVRIRSALAGKKLKPVESEVIQDPTDFAGQGYTEYRPGSGIWQKLDENGIEIDRVYETVMVNGRPVPKYTFWRQQRTGRAQAQPAQNATPEVVVTPEPAKSEVRTEAPAAAPEPRPTVPSVSEALQAIKEEPRPKAAAPEPPVTEQETGQGTFVWDSKGRQYRVIDDTDPVKIKVVGVNPFGGEGGETWLGRKAVSYEPPAVAKTGLAESLTAEADQGGKVIVPETKAGVEEGQVSKPAGEARPAEQTLAQKPEEKLEEVVEQKETEKEEAGQGGRREEQEEKQKEEQVAEEEEQKEDREEEKLQSYPIKDTIRGKAIDLSDIARYPEMSYIAKLTGLDKKYGFARTFLDKTLKNEMSYGRVVENLAPGNIVEFSLQQARRTKPAREYYAVQKIDDEKIYLKPVTIDEIRQHFEGTKKIEVVKEPAEPQLAPAKHEAPQTKAQPVKYGRAGKAAYQKWGKNEHVNANLDDESNPYTQAFKKFFEAFYSRGLAGESMPQYDDPIRGELLKSGYDFPPFLEDVFYKAGKADYEAAQKRVKIEEEPGESKPIATQEEPASQKEETVVESKQEKPHIKVANFVTQKLKDKEAFTSDQLFKIADMAYGGTQAQGRYTPKDAYDAMELGVNKYLLERKKSAGPMVDVETAKRNLESIQKEILENIPTQTKRTAEMDEFQQFSTPPNLAYVAAWAANIHSGETVLEPSAGIGGLAVFAKTAKAKVVVNELSKRRLELLKEMGFDRVFNEDAEQIDNILPGDIKPTIVLMNPPFSSTAGRMEGKRSTKFSTSHIEQALNRLEPNGRLVMIVGRGMADDAASFKDWWGNIKQDYNVRANVGIDGSNYKKYGTAFDIQLVVIDKTGPTTEPIVTGRLTNLEDALLLLEAVRNARIKPTEQSAGERAGEGAVEEGQTETGPGSAVSVPTAEVGAGERGSEDRGRDESLRDDRPAERGGNASVSDRTTEGDGLPPKGRGTVSETEPTGAAEGPGGGGGVSVRQDKGGADRGGLSGTESGIKIESQEIAPTEEDLSEAVYAAYTPQKLKIPGAQQHPGDLAQSAAMAAVEPPNPTYAPNLPVEVIKNGKLSVAQLESIVYAGQAHEQVLPDGQRKGFFIGDGTGPQPLTAKILTPHGWRTMGEIEIGDEVFSVDGTATHVTGVFPQGSLPTYRIHFSDGSSTEASGKHLWLTQTRQERSYFKHGRGITFGPPKIRTTDELASDLHKIHSIPLVKPIQFPYRPILINPWLLGVLLGDGCIRDSSVQLVLSETEMVVGIEESLPNEVTLRKVPSRDHHYYIVKPSRQWKGIPRTSNPLIVALREYGLTDTNAITKFIPDDYKFNTPEVRLAVLRGLMDTDGTCGKKGSAVYYTVSNRLADDVVFIVRSLGGIATRSVKKTTHRDCHVVYVKMPAGINPFSLSRKASRVRTSWEKYPPQRIIKSIEPIGKRECRCILIEHESHLYVTDDLIVTHNTGKGREISGIILDNYRQGRKKAVWVSKNAPLLSDARRDFKDIGGNPDQIFDFGKIKLGMPVKQSEGVMFTTYHTLSQGLEVSREGSIAQKEGKKSRLDQIVNWLGKDYDGVIAFDEAHHMQNSLMMKGKRGNKKPSSMALAGVELQKRLPNARVIYVSATGATEVSNLAYADRLGLWGEGTPFANKRDFISKIQSGGLAAMELVARDMKAMGVYIARNLSFEGVTYGTLEHKLTDEQTEIYDAMAKGWQIVLQNIGKALEATGQNRNGNAKSNALAQFWGSQQRFFNQVLTSMQMPSVIEQVKEDLNSGKAVVMQLVNTNEAIQNKAIARQGKEDSLEDLDLTPRDILMQYLDKSFPTQQYEDYTDENGNERSRPVVDSHGNPVQNRQAVAMKEELMAKLGAMKVPEGPLEIVLNTFGPENVAEITGRTRRIVRVKDGSGRKVAKIESRTPKHAEADAGDFMNDKKQILIFSDAGGTGRSYHADARAKNQRKRQHYLIQAGWRADSAVQGFGRTHRTNEVDTPHYILVTTDLKGQKRFISSIARRLDQLGALTKGQRQTGSQGLFSAKDNLESNMARDALQRFYEDLVGNQIPGLQPQGLIKKMGLEGLVDEYGNLNQKSDTIREIPKFLNRILALDSRDQNMVFDAFFERLELLTERAIANGTLDTGLENFRADRVKVLDEKTVFTDEKSGAETKYAELEAAYKNRPVSFKQATKASRFEGFYRNTRSGRIYGRRLLGNTTLESGGVVRVYEMQGQTKDNATTITEPQFNRGNWEKVEGAEAEKLWQEALDKVPEYRTQKVHLITGAILPIWDRLPQDRVRVIRVKTDDGRVMLGRIIPERAIDPTLRRLGAQRDKQQVGPEQLVDKILKENYEVYLSNEWKLVKRRVSGENRIELIGDDLYRFMDELGKDGVFTERINWQTRFFVPTGDEAAAVIASITKYRPVVDMIAPSGKEEGAGNTFALPSATLRGKVDKILANRITEDPGDVSRLDIKHSPQKTSLNQVAAGLRSAVVNGIFKKGMLVADVGGGLWEKGTEYLAGKGITNLVYDPYARTEEHNNSVLKRIEENGGADAAALNNVLNVIPTAEERADTLKFLYKLLRPGGKAVITVYEGNRTGQGARKVFKDGTSTWQENRPYGTYEEEIRNALPDSTILKKYGMFIITKPAMIGKNDYQQENDASEIEKQTDPDTFAFAKPKKKKQAPPPPRPVNVNPDEPSKLSPKAAMEISNIIGKQLDTVIRGARLGKAGRKSLGYYMRKVGAGKVRRKYLENWRVTGHELGHAFHFLAGFKPNVAEMRNMVQTFYPGGQAPQGKQTSEGLAEFFMLWFADNAEARNMAPKTAEALEAFLDANPELQKAFNEAQLIAEQDLAGTPLERMRHLTSKRGIRYGPAVGEEYAVPWWKRLLYSLVDYTIPFKDLFKAAAEKGYEGLDPAKVAAISGMAREQAIELFKSHARDKAGRFLIPGKRTLLEIVDDAAKIPGGVELMDWIYKALRYEERAEKGFETPYPKEEIKAAAEQARQDYPELVKLVEEYSEILSEINLRLLVRGNVISEETADRVRQGSKLYLPLYTVGRPAISAETSQRRSSGPGVTRYRGHTGQTLDFIEASIMRLADTALAVEVNRLLNTIEETLREEGMGIFGIIEDRPEVVRKITVGKLKSQLKDFLDGEMDPDDEGRVISLFMSGNLKDLSKNEPVLVSRHGDTQVFMRVAPDIYRSVLSMKPITFSWVAKALSYIAQAGRIGALANIRFLTNSVIRDIVGSNIQTQTPERSMVLGFIRGAIAAAGGNKELMSLYIQSGAYGSAVQEMLDSIRRSGPSAGLLSTKAPGWKRTATGLFVRVLHSPLDVLRIFEEAPRVPEFEAVLKKDLARLNLTMDDIKKGNIPDHVAAEVEKALVEAAYASREVLVNFGLHGTTEWFRQYARTVPFLQGGVQGIYRGMRQAVDKPGPTLLRWMMYVLPLTLIAWGLSHKDDRYRDMQSDQRDRYWWFPISDNFFIALAKPYDYALPANILERFLDWAINQDDPNRRKPFEDIGRALKTTFGLPLTSMVVDTVLGIMTNKNWYGGAIEPEREKGLPPELRYGPGNTAAAIKLAELLAKLMGDKAPSPRQIDYFMGNAFGGFGKTGMKAVSKVIPGEYPETQRTGLEYAPFIGPLIYGPGESGSRITDRFYKDYDRAQKLYNAAKLKAGVKGDKKEDTAKILAVVQNQEDARLIQAIPAMRAIADDLAELRKELREINSRPDVTAEQKRLASLKYNWMSKVAAGFLYGQPVPKAPEELGITEAHVQDEIRYYESLAQKAMRNAIKKPGGPL